MNQGELVDEATVVGVQLVRRGTNRHARCDSLVSHREGLARLPTSRSWRALSGPTWRPGSPVRRSPSATARLVILSRQG